MPSARTSSRLRCPSCDEPKDLLHEASSDRDAVLSQLCGLLGVDALRRVVDAWLRYTTSDLSPADFVVALVRAVPDAVQDGWTRLRSVQEVLDDVDGHPPEPLGRAMNDLPKLIVDLERRAALQLAWYRKFPMCTTPCCGEPMCFKCKLTGHHYDDGSTCADVQRQANEIDAQFCPACGVATVRSEGCSHMICVCGENWTWEGGSDDEYND